MTTRRLITNFSRYDHDADELITIQIICSETNAYHKYYEQREVLVRSPVLAKFFSSIHFQPHAQTTMIFTQYPTMILQTVLMHLLHGSNAVEALRAALMKFKIKERICRYIELITLAKKFTMYQLNIDVIDLLRANLTADVKPEHCIMLVEMLYLPNPVRDIMIKAWANQCITNNLDALWKIPRFVHLAKTSWLKFEVDSFPTYEVCPWEAQDKKVEEAKKGEGEEEQPWVAGAAPGSQLGASPPPKKKGKWWKKGGGGAPAAVGAGAGVVAAPAAAGGAVGGAAAAAAGGPAGESAGGAGGGSAGGAAGGLAGGAAGGLAGVAAAGPAVGSAGGAVGAAVGGAAGGAAGKKKGLVARLFCH